MVISIREIQKYNPSLSTQVIEGILKLLSAGTSLSNNELIRTTGLPKETLKHFKKSISFMLQESSEDTLLLKEEFQSELTKMNLSEYKWTLVDYSHEKRARELSEKIIELRKSYITKNADRSLDQFYATEDTTASKALLMEENGSISDKRIVFIGDDDLVSLSVAILNPNYSNVTVLEVDPLLASSIEKAAKDLSLSNFFVVKYDVRFDLDSKYLFSFDTVVVDPPYTKTGVNIFLYRATQLLKKIDSQVKIYLYYGNSFKTPEKTLKIQEIITRLGLVIKDKISNFAHYYGAESIGSSSSAYILTPTSSTFSVLSPVFRESIYTYETQKEEKFPYVDHWVIKIFEVPTEIMKSRRHIEALCTEFCQKHKLKVVDTKVTSFKGQGLTLTYILASSNLLIHTWPEYNALHLDLITCSPIYNRENMVKTLCTLFDTKNIEVLNIE